MGLMNFVNLAHGAFAMMGGFLCVVLMRRFGDAVLADAAAGVRGHRRRPARLLERMLYRRLYRASRSTRCCSRSASPSWSARPPPGSSARRSSRCSCRRRSSARSRVLGIDLGAYRLFLIGFVVGAHRGLALAGDRTRFGAQLRAAVDNPRRRPASASTSACSSASPSRWARGWRAWAARWRSTCWGWIPTFALKYLVYFLLVVVVGGAGIDQGLAGRGAAARRARRRRQVLRAAGRRLRHLRRDGRAAGASFPRGLHGRRA